MKKHILLTNDFLPKVGGIQSYLYEVYSRLDPDSFLIVTTGYPGAEEFDKLQSFKIIRYPSKVLLPTKRLSNFVIRTAQANGCEGVLIDPIFPLGLISRFLRRSGLTFGYIVHGAELTVYARLFVTKPLLKWIIKDSKYAIAAGIYPLNEFKVLSKENHHIKTINVPPGVDTSRFGPCRIEKRNELREKWGLDPDDFIIVSVSRLVKRKGMDELIRAADELKLQIPNLKVVLCGTGRDRKRLTRLNKALNFPVTMIGKVDYRDLPEIYSLGDIFVMTCRDRWFGLEQEGFGIVFLEAAASELVQIAGKSGGSFEAVEDNETGFLVSDKSTADDIVKKVNFLYNNPEILTKMARQARLRAENDFNYIKLSKDFGSFLAE